MKLIDQFSDITEIFTDASFGENNSYWGFIVKDPISPVLKYGPGCSSFFSSAEVEAMAVIKALNYAKDVVEKGCLVIHTDLKLLTNFKISRVNKQIERSKSILNYLLKRIHELINEIQLKNNIIIVLTFIKAHQINAHENTLYNRVVDQQVRKLMRHTQLDLVAHKKTWKDKLSSYLDSFLKTGIDSFLNANVSWDNFPEHSFKTSEVIKMLKVEANAIKCYIQTDNRYRHLRKQVS